MKPTTQALMLVSLMAMTGCAGARTNVVAPNADVPLSLSRSVRDANGTLVGDDRREVLGQLDADGTAWGMLYSGIKLTPEMDVSEAVNQEVKRLHGDAVVNVSIATRQCGLNWAPLVNALPFWPGCANVHIHGDIIRVKTIAPVVTASPVIVVATNVSSTPPKSQGKRARTSTHKPNPRTP